MIRNNYLYIVIPTLLAIYQLRSIWFKIPLSNPKDTEIEGKYTDTDRSIIAVTIITFLILFTVQAFFEFFPISKDTSINAITGLVGNILVFAGFFIATRSLKQLGDNWSGLNEYRIKKGQKLVSSGMYALVRHPIYFAIILEVLGYELAANSWLFVPISLILFYFFRKHILLEEELLQKKFKDEYLKYKNKVKMLIPFIY